MSSQPTSSMSLTFQSTPSGGKATNPLRVLLGQIALFQSTPSGGKATVLRAPVAEEYKAVSIHAFRGEGDRNI